MGPNTVPAGHMQTDWNGGCMQSDRHRLHPGDGQLESWPEPSRLVGTNLVVAGSDYFWIAFGSYWGSQLLIRLNFRICLRSRNYRVVSRIEMLSAVAFIRNPLRVQRP